MKTSPTKKKARRIRSGPQHRAAKRSVATGDPIPLSTKDKRLLNSIEQNVSWACDAVGEARNNVARGEGHFLRLNLRSAVALCARVFRARASLNDLLRRAGK